MGTTDCRGNGGDLHWVVFVSVGGEMGGCLPSCYGGALEEEVSSFDSRSNRVLRFIDVSTGLRCCNGISWTRMTSQLRRLPRHCARHLLSFLRTILLGGCYISSKLHLAFCSC